MSSNPFEQFDDVSPQRVNHFHNNSDTDSSDLAQHHTLGYGSGQAAPGQSVSNRFTDHEDRITEIEKVGRAWNIYWNNTSQALAASTWTKETRGGRVALAGTDADTSEWLSVTGGDYTLLLSGIYIISRTVRWTGNTSNNTLIGIGGINAGETPDAHEPYLRSDADQLAIQQATFSISVSPSMLPYSWAFWFYTNGVAQSLLNSTVPSHSKASIMRVCDYLG